MYSICDAVEDSRLNNEQIIIHDIVNNINVGKIEYENDPIMNFVYESYKNK